jgi:hypothetical protein
MPNKYDLTILNCSHSIYNLFEAEIDILKPNSYKLKQRLREYVNGNLYPTKKIEITSFSYFSKLQNYYQLKLNGVDFENLNLKSKFSYAEIEKIEELILNSGLGADNITLEEIFKQLFDHYFLAFITVIIKNEIENPIYDKNIILLLEFQKKINSINEIAFIENTELYFTFLILLMADYGVLYIEDILNHHLNKTTNKNDFVKSLTKHIILIPEPLQDDKILNQINLWIKSNQDSDGTVKPKSQLLTFENNFDNINPTDIYKHFKAGLVEKKYLTEQQLNMYLKAAFELKTIPETLFKIKDAPNKATIEAVFYTYYKNVAGKIHGRQNQYAALLGDYFEGYKTTTVSTNFSKSVY